MKRQSSSQTKARAASITYYQQNEYAVYPEAGAPVYQTTFQGTFAATSNAQSLQANAYPQQFGHYQDYYPHEFQYPI
jgi:hypothetical protein